VIDLNRQSRPHLDALTQWLAQIRRRRWPDAQMSTHGEFGLAWQEAQGAETDFAHRFV